MSHAITAVSHLQTLISQPPSTRSRLIALTPHDGRYGEVTYTLANFCSEAGLQRLRTFVEVEYLIFLNRCDIDGEIIRRLRTIYVQFDVGHASRIKEFEEKIRHDVKAVEYFASEKVKNLGLARLMPEVHKFLTSEDVTNIAIGIMVQEARKIISLEIQRILDQLKVYAQKWAGVPMLARTHGQPASPTTVGKEFVIFANRLQKVLDDLMSLPIEVKCNGATGNYNAHHAARPDVDWINFSKTFVEDHLGFRADLYTGQTSSYLYLANILHQMKNMSSILIDLARDMWSYISYDMFKLKLVDGEVGSSVMPHKVNPIDFENAEGNFELAEVNLGFLASKLQKSRMQRDLSDSTTLRNLGLVFGWCVIGMKSMHRGLGKIDVNEVVLQEHLVSNPAVLSEAIQSVMREHGIDGAYERLKEVTRGQVVTFEALSEFISSLKEELPSDAIDVLSQLGPETYTGLAERLVEHFLEEEGSKKKFR